MAELTYLTGERNKPNPNGLFEIVNSELRATTRSIPGSADGLATLDASGKIPTKQIPDFLLKLASKFERFDSTGPSVFDQIDVTFDKVN